MARFSCILLGLVIATASHAASTSIKGPGRVYYVALFDPAAVCTVEDTGESGAREARCSGSGFFVSATDTGGCGDSQGPTFCASKSHGEAVIGANELSCLGGAAYILSAGLGEVRCKHGEGYLECVSFDGASTAEASCDGGCGSVTGAGVCCSAKSEWCPPGLPVKEK